MESMHNSYSHINKNHFSISHESLHSVCITFFCTVCFFCMNLHVIIYSLYAIDIHAYVNSVMQSIIPISCHLLSPGAWHMTSIVCHQRRSTAEILSKLTCVFRRLPPERNLTHAFGQTQNQTLCVIVMVAFLTK